MRPHGKATSRRTSQRSLEKELRSFEGTFEACLTTVLQLKDGIINAKGLHSFQFRLYKALLKLSRFHLSLHEERRRLLARRSKLSPAVYTRRQQQLAFRIRIVVNAIKAGRGLGDAFLWFFYHADPELLRHHSEQPAPSLPPPLDGGESELALVGGVRFFGNKFILFHGITTLFRLGDASLYDPATRRIVGIGELKTTRIGPRELKLRFFATLNPDVSLPASSFAARTNEGVAPLDAKRQARLDKQLATISRAVAAAHRSPDAKHELLSGENKAHVKDLGVLVNEARPGRPAIRQFSPGLLAVAIASRTRTMRGRLATQRAEPAPKRDELLALSTRLMLVGSKQNCLMVSRVFYQRDWEPYLGPGTTPILFWPADTHAVRSLATGRVTVITIFNPAHMFATLEQRRISVADYEPPHRLSLRAERDGKALTLERAEYFLRLVSASLYSEEYATRTIDETLKLITVYNDGARIDLTMTHSLFF